MYCYCFYSTVGLAQAWDQLDQLAMRMQHNLEQQIQARNQSGVTEEALREFSMMFKHFDKVIFYIYADDRLSRADGKVSSFVILVKFFKCLIGTDRSQRERRSL